MRFPSPGVAGSLGATWAGEVSIPPPPGTGLDSGGLQVTLGCSLHSCTFPAVGFFHTEGECSRRSDMRGLCFQFSGMPPSPFPCCLRSPAGQARLAISCAKARRKLPVRGAGDV